MQDWRWRRGPGLQRLEHSCSALAHTTTTQAAATGPLCQAQQLHRGTHRHMRYPCCGPANSFSCGCRFTPHHGGPTTSWHPPSPPNHTEAASTGVCEQPLLPLNESQA